MEPNVTAFLTVMATLSAASQALVDLIKKRWAWLNKDAAGKNDDARVAVLHILAGVSGAALTWISGLKPLLNLDPNLNDKTLNIVAAGFLVSFGGGLFNDLLGVFKQLKDAQKALKQEREARRHMLQSLTKDEVRAAAVKGAIIEA